MRTCETLIVGAGAAGLGCATALKKQQKDFLVIEARGRVGGRVMSLVEQGAGNAIELGAEFIHGAPKDILNAFHAYQLIFYDVKDEHLYLDGKKLKPLHNFWQEVERTTKKLSTNPKRDQNINEFIRRIKLNGSVRDRFISFVEGFHSADLAQLGENGLADASETDDDTIGGSQTFRPLGRYDHFLNLVADDLHLEKRLELRTVLKKVRWQRGAVEVTCESGPSKTLEVIRCKKTGINSATWSFAIDFN